MMLKLKAVVDGGITAALLVWLLLTASPDALTTEGRQTRGFIYGYACGLFGAVLGQMVAQFAAIGILMALWH